MDLLDWVIRATKIVRRLDHNFWEKAGTVIVVQAEKEKAPGRPYIVNYLIIARPGKPSNNYRDPIRKKFGDRLLSRVCCNRTRGNVFNLRVDSD